jgi:hypothetical protein
MGACRGGRPPGRRGSQFGPRARLGGLPWVRKGCREGAAAATVAGAGARIGQSRALRARPELVGPEPKGWVRRKMAGMQQENQEVKAKTRGGSAQGKLAGAGRRPRRVEPPRHRARRPLKIEGGGGAWGGWNCGEKGEGGGRACWCLPSGDRKGGRRFGRVSLWFRWFFGRAACCLGVTRAPRRLISGGRGAGFALREEKGCAQTTGGAGRARQAAGEGCRRGAGDNPRRGVGSH